MPGQTIFFKFTKEMYKNNINTTWTFKAEKCDDPKVITQVSYYSVYIVIYNIIYIITVILYSVI